MEGMISKEMVEIQRQFCEVIDTGSTAEEWARGLIAKLLEITHGQWLYRNVHVHDRITGTISSGFHTMKTHIMKHPVSHNKRFSHNETVSLSGSLSLCDHKNREFVSMNLFIHVLT